MNHHSPDLRAWLGDAGLPQNDPILHAASQSSTLPALVGMHPLMRAASPVSNSPHHGFSSLGISRTRRHALNSVPHGLSSVLAPRPLPPRTLAAEHARKLLSSHHPYPNPNPRPQSASTAPLSARSPSPERAPYAIQHHPPRRAPHAATAASAAATSAASTASTAPALGTRPTDLNRDSLDNGLCDTRLLAADALRTLSRSDSREAGEGSAAESGGASVRSGDDGRAYGLDGFGSDDDQPTPNENDHGAVMGWGDDESSSSTRAQNRSSMEDLVGFAAQAAEASLLRSNGPHVTTTAAAASTVTTVDLPQSSSTDVTAGAEPSARPQASLSASSSLSSLQAPFTPPRSPTR